MLYYELIEKHLDEKKPVLSDGNDFWTYSQLHVETAKARGYLKKYLKKGDRVLIRNHNDKKTLITVLACIADGYIFVLLHEDILEKEIEQIKGDCRPAFYVDGLGYERIEPNLMERTKLSKETLAYVLYTSGSEGKEKGVTASYKQILFCCNAINRRLKNTKEDRLLCCLPLAFDYGLYQCFLALMNETLLFLVNVNTLQSIPGMLKRWEITAFPTIPSVMNLLVKTSLLKHVTLPCLRYITFTGEYLSVELIKTLMEYYPQTEVVPMYGLTECKRVAIMPFGRTDKKLEGSCGIPLDGVRVMLDKVDQDTGIGELVVSGNNVMEGYWGSLGEDGDVFSSNSCTGERCIHTGDLFRMDKDGFLYFCGRKSRIIKVKGYRISAVQIEKELERLEGIREIAVTGIKDIYCGEKIVIIVSAEELKIESKIRECMKTFPAYMQNYVLIIQQDQLPKNQNGKIDFRELKRRLEINEE